MKAIRLITLLLLACAIAMPMQAQDKKKKEEVTFLVSMTCGNCQKKIEKSIAYEKGVSDLFVDLEKKTVTIQYNPKKTNPDKLKKAIEDLGFQVFLKEKEETKKEAAASKS